MKLEFPSDFTSNGLSFGVLAQKVSPTSRQVGIKVDLAGAPVAISLNTLPGRQGAAGPLVLGPGLSGPERLPRVPAGSARRPARRLGGGLDPALETLGTKAGSTADNGAARAALPADPASAEHRRARSSRSSSRARSSSSSKNLTKTTTTSSTGSTSPLSVKVSHFDCRSGGAAAQAVVPALPPVPRAAPRRAVLPRRSGSR